MAPTKRSVAIAFALASGIVVGALLALGWSLARPAPAAVGTPPRDLNAIGVAIPGGAGDSVRGWYAPGQPGGGAVLLLHPIRGNRTSMIGRARFLHRHGFGVLLVDLQAHGETAGSHISFGVREATDAHAALRYLRAVSPGERLGVLGISLGGAAALLGSTPLAADAMVLEAVYPTITEAAANRLRLRLGAVGALLAPALTVQLPLWAGVSATELRPIDAVRTIHAPLLIIAGEDDPRTTLAESRRLFAAAPEPKSLWIVPSAGHEDYYALQPAAYEAQVTAFLIRVLRAAG